VFQCTVEIYTSPRTKLHDFEQSWALFKYSVIQTSKNYFRQNGVFIVMFLCQDSYSLIYIDV